MERDILNLEVGDIFESVAVVLKRGEDQIFLEVPGHFQNRGLIEAKQFQLGHALDRKSLSFPLELGKGRGARIVLIVDGVIHQHFQVIFHSSREFDIFRGLELAGGVLLLVHDRHPGRLLVVDLVHVMRDDLLVVQE